MHKQRWFCVFIMTVMLFACFGAEAMAEDAASYQVNGVMHPGDYHFIVTISIEGVDATIGRFALDFDETKLKLVNADNFSKAIKPQPVVTVVQDDYEAEDLISNEKGYAMFAWYCSGLSIDATKSPIDLVQLEFELEDGVTAEDFDWDTIRLLDMSAAGNVNWPSGAFIRDLGLKDYFYNVDSKLTCDVNFRYPNSTVRPANLRVITFDIKDGVGQAVAAVITVSNQKITADSTGKAETYLSDGTYTYKVSQEGYSNKYDKLTVAGSDQTVPVTLLTEQQLVDEVAKKLTIHFLNGDSMNAVTQTIGLPNIGQDGATIRWQSSRPEIISSRGAVFPTTQKTQVTLTATVRKNQSEATREFTVTVLSKSVIQSLGDQEKEDNKEENSFSSVFTDLDSVPWAREAIMALAEKGIIKGTSPTTFSPNDKVTRADFMVLLMRMLNPKGEPGGNFADVAPDKYYYKEIALAKELGIAQGSGDNRFEPEANISRQDMMVLTCRALVTLSKLQQEDEDREVLAGFVDQDMIAAYAKEGVCRMVKEGFIAGDEAHKINPNANATRAETAVFLYRIDTNLNETR